MKLTCFTFVGGSPREAAWCTGHTSTTICSVESSWCWRQGIYPSMAQQCPTKERKLIAIQNMAKVKQDAPLQAPRQVLRTLYWPLQYGLPSASQWEDIHHIKEVLWRSWWQSISIVASGKQKMMDQWEKHPKITLLLPWDINYTIWQWCTAVFHCLEKEQSGSSPQPHSSHRILFRAEEHLVDSGLKSALLIKLLSVP
jgi:hypothetical protein